MYHFSYFKEKEKQVLLDFMQQHPFAFLTGSFTSGKQVATQVPILIEEREGELYLQGHIMRNTDHHKALVENPQVLLVFTGPSCYVSASWYSNPQIGSTWNYMSVHIGGNIRFMNNDELTVFMRKMTLKFENGNTKSPTTFDNLPNNFLHKIIYENLNTCYLPCEVAIKLCNAQFYLKQLHPNYSIVVFDATRPLSAQQKMWDELNLPPAIKINYLAIFNSLIKLLAPAYLSIINNT